MTLVYGQIESLTRLRDTLNQKGIDRFNSIGEINDFIKNYERERLKILVQTENELDIEMDNLQAEGFRFQKEYDTLLAKTTKKLSDIVFRLRTRCELIQSRNSKNIIQKSYYAIELTFLLAINTFLKKNSDRVIQIFTSRSKKRVNNTFKKINHYSFNRNEILKKLSTPKLDYLAYTKQVVEGLDNLIAGAVGEDVVVKELKKLSDNNILFNDFSIDFERPTYYKEDKSRIYSIQIDHLLVNKSGIFIIETKNWSKKSIERPDLRSPIEQIKRTGFALYATLNYSRELIEKLNLHHWGEKKIPIRKIVVMINQKPNEKFKFVKIATLKELNSYIKYFDPIFNDSEVNTIVEHLETIKN